MKKIRVVVTPLLCAFILLSNCFAQSTADKASIKGRLTDESGKVLSDVSVALFKENSSAKDSSKQLYKTTITNKQGDFEFATVSPGKYKLVFTHTGFSENQLPLNVEGEKKIDLSAIVLTPKVQGLTGVTVTARKPLIEQADDKIVFNVENDPAAKTETAIDILRKTPFVTVDAENNIQLNGQTNFKVLLNGRETGMFSQNTKEALMGFPGALITKIEVITTPSAKYDAEGVGGIINIITKKKVAGYNGTVSANGDNNGDYNFNTNLNMKWGKVGATLFFSAFIRDDLNERLTTETMLLKPGLFTKRKLDGYRLIDVFMTTGNGEVNWQIDSLNTLSAYSNLKGWNYQTTGTQIITTDFANNQQEVSYYDLINEQVFPTLNIGSDFIKKFKSNKDKEWSFRFNSEQSKTDTYLDSKQDNPFQDRFVKNNSYAKNREYTFQSDYILPLPSNRKLESGVKTIIRKAQSQFVSFTKYDAENDFKVNTNNSDYFKYRQNVYSAYSTYSFSLKKINFRLGARVEHTEVVGDFISSNTNIRQSYTKLLPNLQATIKTKNANSIVVSYSERIQRPYINALNPFVNNNDSLNISYGNPDLKPQTFRSISMQKRISLGQSFIGLTLGSSYSNDMIIQYRSFNPNTGITSTVQENLGKEWQANMNTNWSGKINKDWNVFFNGAMRYISIGKNEVKTAMKKGFTGNANINSNYVINKSLTVSANAGFRLRQINLQGRNNGMAWYGSGINYKLFKEKITASLTLNNLFQKDRYFISYIEEENFRTTNSFVNPSRNIRLALTWNFGKLKENVSKKKGVVNDDLINGG